MPGATALQLLDSLNGSRGLVVFQNMSEFKLLEHVKQVAEIYATVMHFVNYFVPESILILIFEFMNK